MSSSDLEGGQSYRIVVKEIGNATLNVYLRMEEDVLHMKAVDHLTKSEYTQAFTIDDISRMGSYADTEQAAAIMTAALGDAEKGGSNFTSTGINLMFGYTKTPEKDENKREEDVVFDKGTLLQMKRALQRQFNHMNGDPSDGDTLALKVELKQGFYSDFFVFELPIRNKDDITGRLVIMNQDRKEEIDSLRAEVVRLTELVRKLEPSATEEKTEEKPGDGLKVSAILNDQTRARLVAFLPQSRREGTLIYRATVNGQTAANFHAFCDHEGPTVVLASANGQVFGGYSTMSWNTVGVHVKDYSETSFLFNLTQNKRFNQKKNNNATIYCHPSYGPCFGSTNDLFIVNNPRSSACACAPSNYEGDGYSNSSLAGSNSFTLTDLEVFRV